MSVLDHYQSWLWLSFNRQTSTFSSIYFQQYFTEASQMKTVTFLNHTCFVQCFVNVITVLGEYFDGRKKKRLL